MHVTPRQTVRTLVAHLQQTAASMNTTPGISNSAARKHRRNNEDRSDVRISKALSYTLRHGAEKEGLKLRPDGYANVAALLAMKKFKQLELDFDKLKELVNSNDKQRFTIIPAPPLEIEGDGDEADPAKHLIRANQGHSIAITSEALELTLLLPSDPDFPAKIIHGTFYWAYEKIITSGGLKTMGRNHIHFAPADAVAKNQGVISGMRKDAEVVFVVDVLRAAQEGGLKFWRSANSVVLTEGDDTGTLGMVFVDKVEDRRGLGVLWEDGKVVKELPANLRGRNPPRGKEHVMRREGNSGNREGRKKDAKRKEDARKERASNGG